jgi:transposase
MSLSLEEPASGVKAKRRRRLWSADEKRRMIDECRAPGASVAEVALRHGVNANLLFTWKRQSARDGGGEGAAPVELVPVRVTPEAQHPDDAPGGRRAAREPGGGGRMEIVLGDGARIVVGADVDAAALGRVIRALSRR